MHNRDPHMMWCTLHVIIWFNPWFPRQNSWHSTDDIFKCICCFVILIALKLISKKATNNKSRLLQVMPSHRKGDYHYLDQRWPCSLMRMYVIGGQRSWLNKAIYHLFHRLVGPQRSINHTIYGTAQTKITINAKRVCGSLTQSNIIC